MRQTAFATTAVTLFFGPGLAWAQEADASALFDVMRMPELIGIMQAEGLVYGDEIGEQMLGGTAGPDWPRVVAQIYDAERMTDTIRGDFVDALEGVDIAPLMAFYGSDLGQRIIGLEVSAREAMIDDAVEEAAREFAAVAMADETDRYQLVSSFVEVNDLVERNVMGSMNSNVAFFRGLADGGAFGGDLSEDQILADVWSQEAEIRANTTEWVFSFLMLAYEPLEDADLEAYVAFSRTGPGEEINTALFSAFDGEFERISWALGRAAAEEMSAEEL